ncbi:hypothetical protein BMETH_873_0 [methanotrophic bacterial endosymbiont of Bathymodiolus sp.]|nr:hypothetical protein BMETH_873_0 [methanotrophic bacterial endosymbiont of Bathymodiolus sp.]
MVFNRDYYAGGVKLPRKFMVRVGVWGGIVKSPFF